jgi:chromosome segregation ATPase
MPPDEEPAPASARDPVVLSPDDIPSLDFPVALRGFEREAVRRRLLRVAADYAVILRQRDRARAQAAEFADGAAAAQAELRASARDVAALTKSCADLKRELEQAHGRITGLEQAAGELEPAGSAARAAEAQERELALARDRVAELESEVRQLRETQARAETVPTPPGEDVPEPTREVDELLRAALRAAETLRNAAREDAQRTLKKARERGADLAREAARQARALEEARGELARLRVSAATASEGLERARAAQADAEREARRVKEATQAEVQQVLASLEAQRQRVQTVLGSALGEALTALQAAGGDSTTLFDDLRDRLGPKPSQGAPPDSSEEQTEPIEQPGRP